MKVGSPEGRILRVRSPRSDEIGGTATDPDGFLDPFASVDRDLTGVLAGSLITVDAAIAADCLVVLGEPGMGKTTELRNIKATLLDRGEHVVWIEGSDLSDQTFDDDVAEAINDPRPLTLIIDGLDESPIVRRIASRIGNAVMAAASKRLKLIIGCRTADLPPNVQETLEKRFDACLFVDLAPLSRVSAARIAGAFSNDGQALVDWAVEAHVGPLAAVPLTLKLLARIYDEDPTATHSPEELFMGGITELLDEPDNAKRDALRSTLDMRLAIAERIAAVLLLSGCRTAHIGRALEAGAEDVRSDLLAGGQEATSAGTFDIDRMLVKETLETALFAARGADRVAFVHASHGAFLAASFLRRRNLPRKQIESLLLVAAPDGSRSIPTPLRETAAWLAGLDPVAGAWLAEADPQSLVAHGPVLESNAVRSLVVACLLRRADEFELQAGFRTDLRLGHPGLAGQVAAVLANYPDGEPDDWRHFARCRLALRLAAVAQAPELLGPTLEIAEHDLWNSHLRSMAAQAAMVSDRAQAAPRLTALLLHIADPAAPRDSDPDDELKAHLLEVLWPGLIDTATVLPTLTERRSELIGGYSSFLRDFGQHLPEQDIDLVLARLQPQADRDLIDGVVARALSGQVSDERLSLIASLVWGRLDEHENHPELPEALDDLSLTGESARQATALRRRLAVELVRQAAARSKVGRWEAWQLLTHWTARRNYALLTAGADEPPSRWRLLSSDDFQWALEQSQELQAEESEAAAKTMAEIAALLFDPEDRPSLELADTQRGTVNWPPLAHHFDAIPLASELADQLRRSHRYEAQNNENDDPTFNPSEFRSSLQSRLETAETGSVSDLWLLIWDLQFDMTTGTHDKNLFERRLSEMPGVDALGPGGLNRLTDVGIAFLLAEHDHADEWLGSGRYDKRAWAGYLLLAHLVENDLADRIPGLRLASWAGAVLWFWSVPWKTGDAESKTELLNRTIDAVPSRLTYLCRLYTRGLANRGESAPELNLVDPTRSLLLRSAWIGLLTEVGTAATQRSPRPPQLERGRSTVLPPATTEEAQTLEMTWQALLARLAKLDPPAAESYVLSLPRSTEAGESVSVAATGFETYLREQPERWPALLHLLMADEQLGNAVAERLATAHSIPDLASHLSDEELALQYNWLRDLIAKRDNPEPPDKFGGLEWELKHWRDGLLTRIADRGTEKSVLTLQALHERYPRSPVVTSNLVRARIALFATAWTPPDPHAVLELLADARRRLVRDPAELQGLVVEMLQAIAAGFGATGELLWDRFKDEAKGHDVWAPKPEAALSAYLTNDLRLRLEGRGLAVSREVLVKPTNAYGAGDRTDILVEATAVRSAVQSTSLGSLRLVIEVKCAWNDGLFDDLQSQLVDRYLPEVQTETGVYVVGWYPTAMWTGRVSARSKVPGGTVDELQAELAERARALEPPDVSVAALVMSIPRPTMTGAPD